MQLQLYLEMRTAGGQAIRPDLYYSVFRWQPPFTNFPGYTAHAKKPWPKFPQAESLARDPRLERQEAKSKIVGDTNRLAGIQHRRLQTIPGLQFAPKVLTVPADSTVALTVENTDPSMPHNLVIVQPERLDAIFAGSMKLATSPRGAARHYTIEDEGVIALSPILQPGGRYIVYFDAPKKPGTYPFLCTFPGHGQVMRGELRVTKAVP
jgi:azurin